MTTKGGVGQVPRPFLKWPGGKRQLMGELLLMVRATGRFKRYHEPFLGGGALFFELVKRDMVAPQDALLSDINANIIGTYQALAADVDGVVGHLEEHNRQHSKDYYSEVRGQGLVDPVERAARVIYLNRTCFNGLYRENRKGQFNAPMGKYKNPTICDEPTLRAAATVLANASVEARDFESVLDRVEPGDLVYCDPPYVPRSRTASFTQYGAGKFDLGDQQRLADMARDLNEAGAFVLLSNADMPMVHQLYSGFFIEQVQARRAINSKGGNRGPVSEVIIRNY